jgi:transposase-like protein
MAETAGSPHRGPQHSHAAPPDPACRKATRITLAKITIDKSGANTAAIESYNTEHDTEIEIRRVKYLNNFDERDHRAIKRQMRPMMGFKSFWSAAVTLAGIELMHMIRKTS